MNDSNSLCLTCLSNVQDGAANISQSISDFLHEVLHFNLPAAQQSWKLVCLNCYKTLIELRRFCAQLRDVEEYFKNRTEPLQIANDDQDSVEEEIEEHEKRSVTQKDNAIHIEPIRMNSDPISIQPETVINLPEQEEKKVRHFIPAASNFAEKRYVCLICSNLFCSIDELRTHEATHNNDAKCFTSTQKRFVCPICGIRFALTKSLLTHQKVHEKERSKPFRCGKCNRRFITENALSDHELIHTDVQMSECEICNKKYFNESTLKAHMRTAHNCISDDTSKEVADL